MAASGANSVELVLAFVVSIVLWQLTPMEGQQSLQEEPVLAAAAAAAAATEVNPQELAANPILQQSLLSPEVTEEVAKKKQHAKKYVVRYEGNNSSKWDGKEIVLESEFLESLVEDPAELVPGKIVRLPWEKKGGGTQDWFAVIVDEKG